MARQGSALQITISHSMAEKRFVSLKFVNGVVLSAKPTTTGTLIWQRISKQPDWRG